MASETLEQRIAVLEDCLSFVRSARRGARASAVPVNEMLGFPGVLRNRLTAEFNDNAMTTMTVLDLLSSVDGIEHLDRAQPRIRSREDRERDRNELEMILRQRLAALKSARIPTTPLRMRAAIPMESNATLGGPNSVLPMAVGPQTGPPAQADDVEGADLGSPTQQHVHSQPPFVGSGSDDGSAALEAHRRQQRNIAAIITAGEVQPLVPPVTVDAPVPRSVEAVGSAVGSSTVTGVGVGVRLERIEGILQELMPFVEALARGYQQRDSIGGNFPPDPIEAPPLEPQDIIEGIAASHAARSQPDVSQPSAKAAVHLSALVLGRIGRKAVALSAWCAKKGDTFVEEAAKSAGKSVGLSAGPLILLTLTDLNKDIGAVVAMIEHLLSLAH